MSTFEVKVVRIDDVLNHPNADRLSLNKIGGFVAVSNKDEDGNHRYQPGQLVVYVPEGAVVPLDILLYFGYTDNEGKGILAGSKGNRVKAIKLRDVVSQGLIFPLSDNMITGHSTGSQGAAFVNVSEGDDIADLLAIVKYEPVIPASMSGEVIHMPSLTLNFDVENLQKYPDAFEQDEYVYATEKLHGTFAAFVFTSATNVSEEEAQNLIQVSPNIYATAFSKGLGAKGLVFKATPDNISRNIYLRALANLLSNETARQEIIDNVNYIAPSKLTLIGEIYGRGVQDLTYSLDSPSFAMFGAINDKTYMNAESFFNETPLDSIPRVPLIYQGPFGQLIGNIEGYRDGKSMVDGITLREGIVVTPQIEGRDDRFGRRALKLVSPNYLLRKGGTEYT